MVDFARNTTGVILPRVVSQDIWAQILENSAVMQAATRTDLPGVGVTIPMITAEPTAAWVLETAEKPVSRGAVSSKNMTPYTIAVIVPFSNQFRRDVPGLYRELVRRLPAALARRFDETVYGVTAAPGTGFDNLSAAPTLAVDATGTFTDVLAVVTGVAGFGYDISHWIVNPQLHGVLLGSVNGTGQQYFTIGQRPDGTIAPSIFGAPVLRTRYGMPVSTTVADTIGWAGDFAGASYYGVVEQVTVSLSDQATINDGGTQLNLWQRNMFAVKAEIEVGFVIRDANAFVRINEGAVDTP
jgi:HK97 family phage major capsid protein